MKISLKKIILSSILLVTTSLIQSQVSQADTTSEVAAIRITNLRAQPGRYLHVFYVSARPAGIDTPGAELKVRAILKPLDRIAIPPTGTIDLAATSVPKSGFMSFNYLVLAITGPQPSRLFMRNTDNSVITDPRASQAEIEAKPASDFASERMGYIDALRLRRLPTSGQTILLDASQDLH